MGNRRGVSKNWLPAFLGSTQLYLSYYQPKTITSTRYLVELIRTSAVVLLYLPYYSGNDPIISYKLPYLIYNIYIIYNIGDC